MEGIVQFRLVDYYAEYEDPIDGQTKRSVKFAGHGQRLSTEESGDDANTVYGVRESEFQRLDKQGVFFSQTEVGAMEAGVTDVVGAPESTDSIRGAARGDTHTSIADAAGDPDHSATSSMGGSGGPHPLTFGQMAAWQIEEYLRNAEPSEQDILDSVGNDPVLAAKFLTAEQAVNPEPREELLAGLSKVLGGAQPRGPEGSEGVEGTDGTEGSSGTEATEGGEAPTPPPTGRRTRGSSAQTGESES